MFDNRMMFVGRDFYRTARAELVHSGLLFDGVRLPTAHGLATGWLETSGTKIVGVGAGAPPAAAPRVTRIDGRGRTLLPGFVDVHTHGRSATRSWTPTRTGSPRWRASWPGMA